MSKIVKFRNKGSKIKEPLNLLSKRYSHLSLKFEIENKSY